MIQGTTRVAKGGITCNVAIQYSWYLSLPYPSLHREIVYKYGKERTVTTNQ